jgi:hypothetical protein
VLDAAPFKINRVTRESDHVQCLISQDIDDLLHSLRGHEITEMKIAEMAYSERPKVRSPVGEADLEMPQSDLVLEMSLT